MEYTAGHIATHPLDSVEFLTLTIRCACVSILAILTLYSHPPSLFLPYHNTHLTILTPLTHPLTHSITHPPHPTNHPLTLPPTPPAEMCEFARTVLSRTLALKHPDFFAAHFSECVVVVNDCQTHPVYLAAASSGADGGSCVVTMEGGWMCRLRIDFVTGRVSVRG